MNAETRTILETQAARGVVGDELDDRWQRAAVVVLAEHAVLLAACERFQRWRNNFTDTTFGEAVVEIAAAVALARGEAKP